MRTTNRASTACAETDASFGAFRDPVELFQVRLDPLSQEAVIEHVLSSLRAGRGGWIVTPNVDILRKTTRDPDLRRLVAAADLAVADGMPLIWASRLKRSPLPARVPTSELVYPLARAAAEAGVSMFLLGDRQEIGVQAARNLTLRMPDLRIAGTYSPPFGAESSQAECEEIARRLTETHADIVICAFGFPKQEKLILQLERLVPGAWFVAAGATLSMLAGKTSQAAPWMRRAGLEWLHRLRLEPRRMFKRYVVHDAPFALRLLATAAWMGLREVSRTKVPSAERRVGS